MPDRVAPPDARIEGRLRADLIAWLATIRPDGRPHNVPVWFWWDGATVLIFSEPATQKVRNLRRSPHVVLALDTADQGEDVVILEGVAELVDRPAAELMPSGFGAKYAALFARLGADPAAMAARYSQPIRVRPTRFVAW